MSAFRLSLSLFSSLRSRALGEHRVNVNDECGDEANMFGALPPRSAARGSEHDAQQSACCQFESSRRKDSALRSVPDVEGCPSLFLQHSLEPELIGSIENFLALQAGSHQ